MNKVISWIEKNKELVSEALLSGLFLLILILFLMSIQVAIAISMIGLIVLLACCRSI